MASCAMLVGCGQEESKLARNLTCEQLAELSSADRERWADESMNDPGSSLEQSALAFRIQASADGEFSCDVNPNPTDILEWDSTVNYPPMS